MEEGISNTNIWRREHGLADMDEKGKSIEDVLMDTMGDVGSPKSMDARAKIFNEQVSEVAEAYKRTNKKGY